MKFPKKFDPYNQPSSKSLPPKKIIETYKELGRITLTDYYHVDMPSIPEGTTHIGIAYEPYYTEDNYVRSVDLIFYAYTKEENPKYSEQLKKHKQNLAETKEERKEWKKLKKLWDEEKKKRDLDQKRAQLEKLKKELGET